MAQPYVGEIRMFAGNFAPAGWMFCEGQLLAISQNDTLFNLIGTTYGGDGQSTFALPDLRGRIPLHQGNGFTLAETGGAETITLTTSQIPAHGHPLYLRWKAGSGGAKAADFVIDAVLLPSPYAYSFGTFLGLATSAWFAAGGVVASLADSFKSKRVGQPGEDALPSDMSTISLIGGGLIAGDALAALGLGLVGLAATLLG